MLGTPGPFACLLPPVCVHRGCPLELLGGPVAAKGQPSRREAFYLESAARVVGGDAGAYAVVGPAASLAVSG